MKSVTGMVKRDTVTRTKERIPKERGTNCKNSVPWSIIAKEHNSKEDV